MAERATLINPQMLRWARERSGYTVEDIAKRRGTTARQVLDWESGDRAPTWRQLEILASRDYHRSTTFFFLDDPPDEKHIDQEFDRLPSSTLVNLHPDTLYAVRQARTRQEHVEQLLGYEGNGLRETWANFTGHLVPAEDPTAMASNVRDRLRLRQYEPTMGSWGYRSRLFEPYRTLVERTGVWVFKRSFKQKDVTGLCINHYRSPVVFLNCAQPQELQIFTLFNQLAHLVFDFNYLGRTDEQHYLPNLVGADRNIEISCNEYGRTFDRTSDVADSYMSDYYGIADFLDITDSLSIEQLPRAQVLDIESGRSIHPEFQVLEVDHAQSQEMNEAVNAKPQGGYYAIKKSHLGERYINATFRALEDERIDEHELSEFLGVTGRHLKRLANYVQR